MTHGKGNRTGFTLTETLAASTILCGAVVTIAAISTQSLRSTKENRQYETAVLLAEQQLCMVDYIGIDEFAELGQAQGVFEGYDPPYSWAVTTQYLDIDGLYLVSLTVGWIDGGRPYSVTVQTMLNGANPYPDEEESGGGSIGETGSIQRGGAAGGTTQ